jgi:hypothetical protein
MLRSHIGILDIGYLMKPLRQPECGTMMRVGSETLFKISTLNYNFDFEYGRCNLYLTPESSFRKHIYFRI